MNFKILISGILGLILLLEINCISQVDSLPEIEIILHKLDCDDDVSIPVPPEIEQEVDVMESDEDIGKQEEEIFEFVEIMPEYPGGNKALFKFLAYNIEYPCVPPAHVQGKVYIQFVVWKDGSVRNVKVLKGLDKSLEMEAIRVIKMMPDWEPGIHKGKPVNTIITLPISFKLN